ncbi:hypothetical protein BGZ65_009103, partial [Modicella reniformis]
MECKNKHTRDSHVLDCHDGGARRADKLACPVDTCGADFQSRFRYEDHLRSKHVQSEAVPHLCPLCDQSFENSTVTSTSTSSIKSKKIPQPLNPTPTLRLS